MAKKSFARSPIRDHKAVFFVILAVIVLLGTLSAMGWHTPFSNADGSPLVLHGVRDIRFGIDIRGGVEAVFAPRDFQGKPTPEEMDAATRVLNFRLDQLQVLDREVTASPSSGRVIVRFPWRSDEVDFNPDMALRELGQMALLTFKDPSGKVIVDGASVVSAQAVYDERNQSPVVSLNFDEAGSKSFAEATRRLVGTKQPIRIFLDDELLSDPVVNAVIENGKAVIEGGFTRERAMDLAGKISAGALPFAMTAISSSTISPSLGQNSLKVMVLAGLVAFALICVYMILRYRLPGFVGCISLSAQIIGILLAISLPQQTLTLQGIAGIILSIGMGVDANIIVAERIREEANTGASLPTFLHNGFTRAFSSVMDGNVTVAIAAIVLMIFGSGTVLSFGYSLLAGVILNGITGVWMTRRMIASLSGFSALQNPWLYGKQGKGKFKVPQFAFYKRRFLSIGIAAFLIVAGLLYCLIGGVKLSIEFKGGSLVSYDYVGEVSAEDCDRLLQSAMDMPVRCQLSRGLSDESTRLQVSIAGNEALTPEQLSHLSESLQKAYPKAEFEISSSQLVNPSIGREMLRNGLLALLIASLLIIAYVWFSFRSMSGPSAGVMALVALFHDILLAAISFILIGSEVNETLIAVVLTILGFSINNTIVIYDRIRENLPKYRGEMSLAEIIDRSINQSLTRSIGTSLCVFAAVFIALIYAIINGLDSIKEFAVPILVGTVAGTFSSVCLSAPLWVMWKTRKGKSGLEA